MTVELNTTRVQVNEGDGFATICLQKDRETAIPFDVEVVAIEDSGDANPANGMYMYVYKGASSNI